MVYDIGAYANDRMDTYVLSSAKNSGNSNSYLFLTSLYSQVITSFQALTDKKAELISNLSFGSQVNFISAKRGAVSGVDEGIKTMHDIF